MTCGGYPVSDTNLVGQERESGLPSLFLLGRQPRDNVPPPSRSRRFARRPPQLLVSLMSPNRPPPAGSQPPSTLSTGTRRLISHLCIIYSSFVKRCASVPPLLVSPRPSFRFRPSSLLTQSHLSRGSCCCGLERDRGRHADVRRFFRLAAGSWDWLFFVLAEHRAAGRPGREACVSCVPFSEASSRYSAAAAVPRPRTCRSRCKQGAPDGTYTYTEKHTHTQAQIRKHSPHVPYRAGINIRMCIHTKLATQADLAGAMT
ncbi:hypothetical protein LY76DRAFT_364583 [Colletotrichum caudatum]|nr:hypothetical protein LY76DRAFT_364583 [Colletotrichum caudatum]